MLKKIDDKAHRSVALRVLVEYLAQRQLWQQALEQAHHIEDDLQLATALHAIAQSLLKAEQWEHAQRLASTIQDEELRLKVRRKLVHRLVLAQQQQAGLAVWKQIMAEYESLEDLSQRVKILGPFILTLIELQQWEDAASLLNRIEDKWIRGDLVERFATALTEARGWRAALPYYEQPEFNSDRFSIMYGIVTSLLQKQHWRDALSLAQALDNDRRDLVLKKIIDALLAEKNWILVNEIEQEIEHFSGKKDFLPRRVTALIQLQQWEQVPSVIDAISDEAQRNCALQESAHAFIEVHRWKQAEQVLASLSSVPMRLRVLDKFIVELRSAQLLEEANEKEQTRAQLLESEKQKVPVIRYSTSEEYRELWAPCEKSDKRKVIEVHQTLYDETAMHDVRQMVGTALENFAYQKTPEARHTLHLSYNPLDRIWRLISQQQWDQAEKMTLNLENQSSQHYAWQWIVEGLQQARQWERAWKLTSRIRTDYLRAKYLRELAIQMTKDTSASSSASTSPQASSTEEPGIHLKQKQTDEKCSDIWEQAEAAASQIQDSYQRVMELYALSEALTQAHRWEQAHSVWQKTLEAIAGRENSIHGRRFLLLVQSMIAARRWTAAESVARLIQDRTRQALALQELALELARTSTSLQPSPQTT